MKQIRQMSKKTYGKIVDILSTIIEAYCKIDAEKHGAEGFEQEARHLFRYHRKDLAKIIRLMALREDESFKKMVDVLLSDLRDFDVERGMIKAIIQKSTQMLQEKNMQAFVSVLFSIGAYLNVTERD